MASIVLLLSELLGGESASVLAADRYIMGGRLSLGEFRPAVTSASAKVEGQRAAAGTEEEKKQRKEESFEDLAVSRIAVDVMWP
ncbi:unnamed protein product [Urochloa decumbens]|uniref:Uncharacterized protein n=1 Tax=Urochloa decumbens TaxID=240449 RepID=A0ABC8YY31_9POAL